MMKTALRSGFALCGIVCGAASVPAQPGVGVLAITSVRAISVAGRSTTRPRWPRALRH